MRVRPAREEETPRIVELIHLGDIAGRGSEQPGPPFPEAYYAAFRDVRAAPNQEVYVAELDGQVVGTFQLAILANLSNIGRRVAQIESVHVAAEWRSHGIGEQMLRWAIAEGRRQGCFRLQLTSDRRRTDAHRFYERLGFVNSHVGMKLTL